jgi:hypothetical protein
MSLFGDGLELLKLVDKGRNASLYKELGEWIDKVADLQKERDDLKAEVTGLREQVRFKASVERVDGHTFVKGDDEEICPSCVAVSGRAVHLEPMRSELPPYVKATCPACKTAYRHNMPVKRSTESS